jgi:hypothetical protein
VSAPKTLSRSRVVTCILINLTATPGLGSLMCRRMSCGLGQLVLALTGFCLIVTWMFQIFYRSIMEQMDKPVPPDPAGWTWKWGVLFFGVAWLWSLVTSIGLWRAAKAAEREAQSDVPPRINDV